MKFHLYYAYVLLGEKRKLPKVIKEKTKMRDGFVEILIGNRYVKLHIHIVEQFYGIVLTREDNIHHLSMDRQDNRPVNLIILSKKMHAKIHFTSKRLIKPLIESGYVTYDRRIDSYILIEDEISKEDRQKIYDEFNKSLNAVPVEIEQVEEERDGLLSDLPNPTTSKARKWSKEEIQIIIDNPGLSMYKIALLFPYRSIRSIRHKLAEMNYEFEGPVTEFISKGYKILVMDGQRISEHRHKIQLHVGYTLLATDEVHHISHYKLDNSLNNLVLFRTTPERSANSAHKTAEGTFNLRVPNLWERGIISYSVASQSYILGENFVANDKNYKRDDTQLLDDLIKFHAQSRKE